jgi:putative transcriptional regulator
MTPSHHPDADELCAYASGATPDWISLVVACHLTYCEECRTELELWDDLGGVLLDSLDPGSETTPPPRPSDAVIAPRHPSAEKKSFEQASESTKGIPRPLHDYFADEPRFRFLAPGIQHIPLSFSVGGVPARIVRFKPGFTIPEHAHRGLEMVLVLDGEIADGVTKEVFRTGDLSRREAGTTHSQHVTSHDSCVCLVVSAAPIVPSTVWGRVLKALTGV